MHESLERMGAVVEDRLGAGRIFKVETVLSNPLHLTSRIDRPTFVSFFQFLTTRMMEASPPNSTSVANVPGEASSRKKQSRIPSARSMSFRKCTDTTRRAVITRKCWLCGLDWEPSLDVAHNVGASIPLGRVCSSFLFISLVLDLVLLVDDLWVEGDSADDERLGVWKGLGILPEVFYPAHIDNLILLCKNCHSGYHCDYPGWVVLPQDLDFFINFEKNDYAARIAAAKHGVQQERALPQVTFLFILLIFRHADISRFYTW